MGESSVSAASVEFQKPEPEQTRIIVFGEQIIDIDTIPKRSVRAQIRALARKVSAADAQGVNSLPPDHPRRKKHGRRMAWLERLTQGAFTFPEGYERRIPPASSRSYVARYK